MEHNKFIYFVDVTAVETPNVIKGATIKRIPKTAIEQLFKNYKIVENNWEHVGINLMRRK